MYILLGLIDRRYYHLKYNLNKKKQKECLLQIKGKHSGKQVLDASSALIVTLELGWNF